MEKRINVLTLNLITLGPLVDEMLLIRETHDRGQPKS